MATPKTPPIPLSAYPMGEPQLMPSFQHLLALSTLFALLRRLLAPGSFVASEVAILTDRGDWRAHLMPDVFVVLAAGESDPVYGVPRRQYRLWDEAGPPQLVIEAASPSTVGRDQVGKKEDYAALGVAEYVQFDPMGTLLLPRLQVFRLGAEGTYEAVPALPDGAVPSQVLPYDWVRVGDLLRVRERGTGLLVPTAEEQADEALARARREAERASREAERANAAEAEVARLRDELARLRERGPRDGGGGAP